MKAELFENAVLVTLSRTNIMTLLGMLDHGIHTSPGLVRKDKDMSVIVIGQEDKDHYPSRDRYQFDFEDHDE